MQLKVYLDKKKLALNVSKSLTANERATVMTDYGLKSYSIGELDFYAFADHLKETSSIVISSMTIPAFFDQCQQEIHGLFLFSLGETYTQAKSFIDDKGIGAWGCPKRLLLQPGDKGYYTFNNMRFYPFLMTDFTVGYYVCDNGNTPGYGGPRYAWRDYVPEELGVALDYPLTYDPTLGLYITRGAHIEYPPSS